MKPVEVPILGVIGIAVAVICASRIFLAVSKSWAIWVAVIISAVVFLSALAFALAEKVNRNVVAGVLATGAIALLASGVASAVVGERDMSHHHGEHSEHSESHEGENGEEHSDQGSHSDMKESDK
jgi:uncharacterized protein involved in response to NO